MNGHDFIARGREKKEGVLKCLNPFVEAKHLFSHWWYLVLTPHVRDRNEPNNRLVVARGLAIGICRDSKAILPHPDAGRLNANVKYKCTCSMLHAV